MQPGVPALISAFEPSAWESCRIITPNLIQAYRLAFGDRGLRAFAYSEALSRDAVELKGTGLLELAREIHRARPSRLIFADHSPHPAPLLTALKVVYGEQPLPPLHFHVYGDFMLRAAWWRNLDGLLNGTPVLFICASGRQATLLSRMFKRGDRAIEICPFPLDASHYRPDANLRREWRNRFQIENGEFTLIYSGRLSLQKNVAVMAQQIADFARNSGVRTRLLVAGRFDDLGAPLFGVHQKRGASFVRFRQAIESLNSDSMLRVDYAGHVGKSELLGLYNAADVFVSQSLHHDEDFGMSPAEALCCGTPAVLSSWGGYSGFLSSQSTDCELAPVHLGRPGLKIDQAAFFRSLLRQSTERLGDMQVREARATRYRERFSIEAVAEVLTALANKPLSEFSGFNDFFGEIAGRMENRTPFPEGPTAGSLYEAVYSAYLGH